MDSIFKKGDYIYFRVKEDDEENSRKAGDIIRYSKEYILSETLNYFDSDYFNTDSVLEEGLNDEEFIKRIFSEQTLLRDYRTSINKEDVDPSTLEKLVSYKDRDLLAKLLGIEDNDRITFAFEKGNVVDLSNPILSRLFFSSRFNNILQETELITDPLKEELFNEDFENAICVTPVEYCDFSFEKPSEHHYYKIKDEIKAQDPFELAKLLNIPYFGPFNYDTIKDEAGFIKYVAVINSYEDKTSRVNEQILTMSIVLKLEIKNI